MVGQPETMPQFMREYYTGVFADVILAETVCIGGRLSVAWYVHYGELPHEEDIEARAGVSMSSHTEPGIRG